MLFAFTVFVKMFVKKKVELPGNIQRSNISIFTITVSLTFSFFLDDCDDKGD